MSEESPTMEFLRTYGWAIICAIIIIGVLVVFGVFNPNTYKNPEQLFCESNNYSWTHLGSIGQSCYNITGDSLIKEIKIICVQDKCYWDKR
jgi:hypothetical protein